MEKTPTLNVQVRRFSPEGGGSPYFDRYSIPHTPGMSVMDVLRTIQENLDPSLAFDCSCRIGICKACALRVDGKVGMACSTVARDGMRIEPVNAKDVRRDLVVRPAKIPEEVIGVVERFAGRGTFMLR